MQAQVAGDYSAALRAYAESLKLEEDPILGWIFEDPIHLPPVIPKW